MILKIEYINWENKKIMSKGEIMLKINISATRYELGVDEGREKNKKKMKNDITQQPRR